MKFSEKIQRLIISIFLAVNLVVASPAYVFAEAQTATEAESAPEASPAPGADTAPPASPAPEPTSEPTPSPSPDTLIIDQTDTIPNVINPDEYQSGEYEDEEQEERERQERIDRYYQYLEDKAEWERTYSGGNVGDTSIQTGDATVGGAVINDANGNYVSSPSICSTCASGQSASVVNEGNGSGSSNSGVVTTDNTNSVVIDNDANVANNLGFKANTGYNDSSGNVGDTEITTGDANVSGVIINSTNQNNLGVIEYNIEGDHNGDIILTIPEGFIGCVTCGAYGDQTAENSENGADSTNDASILNNNETNIDIDNNADVVNNMDLVANSGYNDASKNVGDSTITTGDANVAANVINMLNSTISGGVAFVVNVFGNLVGDIIFPDAIPAGGSGLLASNTGNGSGSTNNATIDNNNVTDVNFDNYADIDNNFNIYANTGANDTNKNTGGNNSIETGSVDVNAEVLTVANTNYYGTSDEPLWLLLVNNMGTWTGQIIGALSGINYSGSEGLVFNVDENGDIIATNSGNGADSTNNAAITNNNNTNIDINNNANLVNNINIDANTGRNDANYNTGGNSTIKTGDANVAASIINFVNTNLIGRNVMIGIVNVFGSWFGDAVPPGEEPDGQSNVAVGGSNVQSQSSSNSSNGGGAGGVSNSNSSSSESQTLFASNNSGKSGGFPFGAIFGGSDDSDGEGGADGSDQGSQVLGSAETSGLVNIRFNLKVLILSLLPILGFGILRYRQLSKKNKVNVAVANEIKKPRS